MELGLPDPALTPNPGSGLWHKLPQTLRHDAVIDTRLPATFVVNLRSKIRHRCIEPTILAGSCAYHVSPDTPAPLTEGQYLH